MLIHDDRPRRSRRPARSAVTVDRLREERFLAIAEECHAQPRCTDTRCSTCGASDLVVALRAVGEGLDDRTLDDAARASRINTARAPWPEAVQAALLDTIGRLDIRELRRCALPSGILELALKLTPDVRSARESLQRALARQLAALHVPGFGEGGSQGERRGVLDLVDSAPTSIVEERAGHLVRRHGGALAILDTGSPLSMPAPAEVRTHVDATITHLVGMDELGRAPFYLDWTGGELRHGCLRPTGGTEGHLRSMLGVPLIEIEERLAGRRARRAAGLLDTGAAVGYAPADVVRGLDPVGARQDFFPGIGAFETPLYEVTIEALGAESIMQVGVLPPLLALALGAMTQGAWILGADFFRGRRLWLDLPGQRIVQAP